MTVNGDELWQLLRSLADPEHLEFQADYDYGATRGPFNQLVDRLDAAFSCSSAADRDVRTPACTGES